MDLDLWSLTDRTTGNEMKVMKEPEPEMEITQYCQGAPIVSAYHSISLDSSRDLSLLEGLRYWFIVGDWESGPRPLTRRIIGYLTQHFFRVYVGTPSLEHQKEGTRRTLLYRTPWHTGWKDTGFDAYFDSTAIRGVRYEESSARNTIERLFEK